MGQVSRELLQEGLHAEPGTRKLIETRKGVERGSWEASEILAAQGQKELAKEVKHFVGRMPPPRTDREMIAEELRKHHRDARAREGPTR